MNAAAPNPVGERSPPALERAGFSFKSQRGSHVKMRHPDGRTAIVPMHSEVAIGTLQSILKQAGLSAEQFLGLLR